MYLIWAEVWDLPEIWRFVSLRGVINESKGKSVIEHTVFVSYFSECFAD